MMVLIGVCEFSKLISKLCSMLHCFITLSSPTCCVGKMVTIVFVCNKLIYTLIFIGFTYDLLAEKHIDNLTTNNRLLL